MRRILLYINNLIKYIRKGGIVYVNISQVNKLESLKGKKILITGGGSGIGLAIARKYLSEGAEIIITGRNEEKLKSVVQIFNSNNLSYVVWDTCDASIARCKLSEVISQLKGLDIIVNNAGVYSTTTFLEMTENEWNRVMDINLKGVFFICQAFVDYVLKDKIKSTRKIINITSIRGFQGDVGPYGISKWGCNGLTKGLAKELIKNNIIVNGIAPGVTATKINGIDVSDNAFISGPKNDRIGLPEEIAEMALFLANDSSNNIIGQIICCDGGELLI